MSRNNRLANIFYRLHLIEAYGTGMLKKKVCYHKRKEQLAIELLDDGDIRKQGSGKTVRYSSVK
ncbi:MAG: hypothetical protein LKJ76_00285 [Lachnospiraceae bacterium]|jgi:predicted HTH transcriptional regulator|nr:hypothetical protein [Lachnospiraceae bacterium]